MIHNPGGIPMNGKKLFNLVLILMSVFTVACELKVPINEMVAAKKQITRAYEVQADRFSPDNLKEATDHLIRAHDYLREDNTDKAGNEADAAYNSAEQAIEQSLPLLADESLKAAQSLRDKCDMVYAEKYAPGDETSGLTSLKEAEDLFEQKEYWQSHLKSSEASTLLGRAVELSMAHKDELTARQQELSALHQKLNENEYSSDSKDELAVAASKLSQAGENLSTDHLRDAFLLLEEADQSLKSADGRISVRAEQVRAEMLSKKIEDLKARIAGLRSDLAAVSSDPAARYAEAQISSAGDLLNQAESGLETNPDSSAVNCDAAQEKITSARAAILSGALLERADALDNERVKLNSQPGADKVQEKLDNAALLISDARALAQTGSYPESSSKLDSAEQLLAAVKSDLEKTGKVEEVKPSEETVVQPGKTETIKERVYVVKYNPKNRDCLWKIAAYEYGNPRLWPLIYVANRNVIKDPDLIFPGQKLVIPPVPEKAREDKPVEPGKNSPATTPVPEKSSTDAPQVVPQP